MENAFKAYADAGFKSDLLPVMPADARPHPICPIETSKNRGKIPGRKLPKGWVGFTGWTKHVATSDDISKWYEWGAGVGLKGRKHPALDIDIDHPELASAVQALALQHLGAAPVRFGRGPRRILVYAADGLSKRRIAFRPSTSVLDSVVEQSVDDNLPTPPLQAIELLGDGQYYVVEGIHAKTGKPYYWENDLSPAKIGAAGLTSVTIEQIDKFFSDVESLLNLHGFEIVNQSTLAPRTSSVWQGGLVAPSLQAIENALNAVENVVDYDTWIKFGAAVKAAAGPEHEAEAFDLWAGWSFTYGDNTADTIESKWASFRPPYKVGWDYLQRFATEEGDGIFYGAAEEFDAVEETPSEEAMTEAAEAKPLTAMFDRYIWVESLALVADTKTGMLLNREKFNVRNRHIGPPTETKACAYAVLTSNVPRLQVAQAITYRPGGEKFVDESLPGLAGRCVNLWKPTPVSLPAVTRYEDVRPWLEHVAFVLPNEQERETVLNWLAWIVQNPGEKPNWALVLGSSAEGIGKDLTLDPVRAALGAANVREIDADDLASGYSDYLAGTRLLIVEEMQMNERKAMMNRLKPLIAAPPYTLRVNVKFQPQYEIPNLIATIFFTNMENALAIGAKDRRYFVTWNDAQPKADAYYTDLVKWFAAGGSAHAARWLLDRDVTGFNAKGKAPMTEAKNDMRKAARSLFDEVLEEGISQKVGPFAHHLLTLDEAVAYVQAQTGERPKISPQRVSRALQRLGLQHMGRLSLGAQPPGTNAPYMKEAREHQVLAWTADSLENDSSAIRNAFWADRADPEVMFQ